MVNSSPTAFSRITRNSGRTNSILTVALPLLFILIATLVWSAERIIQQETKRLEVDFRTLTGYIFEQEKFLIALNQQNQDLSELVESRTYSINYQSFPKKWPLQLLEGKESLVAMPFTLGCNESLECSRVPSILFSLGAYLADFYSTFWGGSYYPAAAVFFINEHDHISIGVPSVGSVMGNESISPELFHAVTDSIRINLPSIKKQLDEAQKKHEKNTVIWIRQSNSTNNLIGVISAGFDVHLWENAQLSPQNIYAASLLSQIRIRVFERMLNPSLTHQFWLTHNEFGQLSGDTNIPFETSEGLFYTKDGLVLKLDSQNKKWSGYYRISYAAFFEDNLWLPISLITALFFSFFCGWGYHRWYQRKILQPAIQSQQIILDNESFNRTLIAITPIGLCVIDRETRQLRFANELAQYWLKITEPSRPQDSGEYRELLSHVITREKHVKTIQKSGDNVLYITSTETNYQQRSVILCAFTDITMQAETEKQLANAKRLAEEANRAKSSFLATMSHEIRTPLYGLIGTLELLSNTLLSPQQVNLINRMSTTSQLLMLLIGDILDISKIEANQVKIQNQPFSLLELIQQTVQLYQGLAQQKNLVLFQIIDPDIHSNRVGDEARLQQIIGNLLSNAIKFTQKGTIIVELKTGTNDNILLRVIDSGVGIDAEQQKKLFEPFYQAHPESLTYGGTGLGLFICSNLVKLMGGLISLQRQPGKGSSFLITLPLKSGQQDDIWEDLTGTHIWLQTINPLLTKNLTQWLKKWGATVYLTQDSLPEDTSSVIAVGILIEHISLPEYWKGKIWLASESYCKLSELNQKLFLLKNNGDLTTSLINPIPRIQAHTDLFSLKVLIAEDNMINQVVLQEQLELLGCQVFTASDGEEALVIWDNEIVDIILTDVNMPYRNGYELTKQLRLEGETCPIIGITANGLKEEEERCLQAGMNAWLVKPIELETLVHVLSRFFPVSQSFFSEDELITRVNPLNSKDREKIISQFSIDIQELNQAINKLDIEIVKQLSHRLRGALVSAEQQELADKLLQFEKSLNSETANSGLIKFGQSICNDLITWVNKLNQTDGE